MVCFDASKICFPFFLTNGTSLHTLLSRAYAGKGKLQFVRLDSQKYDWFHRVLGSAVIGHNSCVGLNFCLQFELALGNKQTQASPEVNNHGLINNVQVWARLANDRKVLQLDTLLGIQDQICTAAFLTRPTFQFNWNVNISVNLPQNVTGGEIRFKTQYKTALIMFWITCAFHYLFESQHVNGIFRHYNKTRIWGQFHKAGFPSRITAPSKPGTKSGTRTEVKITVLGFNYPANCNAIPVILLCGTGCPWCPNQQPWVSVNHQHTTTIPPTHDQPQTQSS